MAAMIMPTEAQLEALFKEFDTSGDGFIEFDELKAALAKAGKVVDDDECKKILAEADENSDGMISFSEFKTVFEQSPDLLPPGLKQLAGAGSLMMSWGGKGADASVDALKAVGKGGANLAEKSVKTVSRASNESLESVSSGAAGFWNEFFPDSFLCARRSGMCARRSKPAASAA